LLEVTPSNHKLRGPPPLVFFFQTQRRGGCCQKQDGPETVGPLQCWETGKGGEKKRLGPVCPLPPRGFFFFSGGGFLKRDNMGKVVGEGRWGQNSEGEQARGWPWGGTRSGGKKAKTCGFSSRGRGLPPPENLRGKKQNREDDCGLGELTQGKPSTGTQPLLCTQTPARANRGC